MSTYCSGLASDLVEALNGHSCRNSCMGISSLVNSTTCILFFVHIYLITKMKYYIVPSP
uniref:Uncharacterized protein n=1 Tax=Rhizophora mucronata TaxID=61149 RepID=A0A2P2IPF0_RHIMU